MTMQNSNCGNYPKTNKIDFKSLAVTGLVVIVALGVFKFLVEPIIEKSKKQKAVSLKD